MSPMTSHRFIAIGLAALGASACAGKPATVAPTPQPQQASAPAPRKVISDAASIAKARADSADKPYVEKDVEFMSGMISHHAQAIAMANMSPTHGAGPQIRTLSGRIINAQTDEIVLMSQWLSDRQKPVPEPRPTGMRMIMNGMEHDMLMPGMLTPAQMKQLDEARGTDFDRLFLTFMIQHHNGAVAMVKELFGTPGAGQDDVVFKFASDVHTDQTTEIARMQGMLAALKP